MLTVAFARLRSSRSRSLSRWRLIPNTVIKFAFNVSWSDVRWSPWDWNRALATENTALAHKGPTSFQSYLGEKRLWISARLRVFLPNNKLCPLSPQFPSVWYRFCIFGGSANHIRWKTEYFRLEGIIFLDWCLKNVSMTLLFRQFGFEANTVAKKKLAVILVFMTLFYRAFFYEWPLST